MGFELRNDVDIALLNSRFNWISHSLRSKKVNMLFCALTYRYCGPSKAPARMHNQRPLFGNRGNWRNWPVLMPLSDRHLVQPAGDTAIAYIQVLLTWPRIHERKERPVQLFFSGVAQELPLGPSFEPGAPSQTIWNEQIRNLYSHIRDQQRWQLLSYGAALP